MLVVFGHLVDSLVVNYVSLVSVMVVDFSEVSIVVALNESSIFFAVLRVDLMKFNIGLALFSCGLLLTTIVGVVIQEVLLLIIGKVVDVDVVQFFVVFLALHFV